MVKHCKKGPVDRFLAALKHDKNGKKKRQTLDMPSSTLVQHLVKEFIHPKAYVMEAAKPGSLAPYDNAYDAKSWFRLADDYTRDNDEYWLEWLDKHADKNHVEKLKNHEGFMKAFKAAKLVRLTNRDFDPKNLPHGMKVLEVELWRDVLVAYKEATGCKDWEEILSGLGKIFFLNRASIKAHILCDWDEVEEDKANAPPATSNKNGENAETEEEPSAAPTALTLKDIIALLEDELSIDHGLAKVKLHARVAAIEASAGVSTTGSLAERARHLQEELL